MLVSDLFGGDGTDISSVFDIYFLRSSFCCFKAKGTSFKLQKSDWVQVTLTALFEVLPFISILRTVQSRGLEQMRLPFWWQCCRLWHWLGIVFFETEIITTQSYQCCYLYHRNLFCDWWSSFWTKYGRISLHFLSTVS